MTIAEPPRTRRELRARATGVADSSPEAASLTAVPAEPGPETPAPIGRSALTWVDLDTLTAPTGTAHDLSAAATPYIPVDAELISGRPRGSLIKAIAAPLLTIGALTAVYAGTTLLWPLTAVPPTVSTVQVTPASAVVAAPAWPAEGSAAVSVAGFPGSLASTDERTQIASITKVLTALLVLDEMPLAPGEQGPDFRFTAADNYAYWQYLYRDESALNVPIGGTLTQYQLLEGILIGSANNYADRLAAELWPSNAVYSHAAEDWLRRNGIQGMTVVDPSGIGQGNTATPEALLGLAHHGLRNPVIAEIVAKERTVLPGAGEVENTNPLIGEPGVVGIKTGFLGQRYNLLSGRDIQVGDTTVRVYAAVLDQSDNGARADASRALFAQVEAELEPFPSVAAGTVVGSVQTPWGAVAPIVTAQDAEVVLWNGGTSAVSSTIDFGEQRIAGESVGALTVRGPLNASTVELRLAADLESPSPWWRLTHPLQLFGLVD